MKLVNLGMYSTQQKAIFRRSMVIRDRDPIETILLAKTYRIEYWFREGHMKSAQKVDLTSSTGKQHPGFTQYIDEASERGKELTLKLTHNGTGC
jgi:hypothetical protein